MLRLVAPPEIEEETRKLLEAWMNTPEEEAPNWEAFRDKHGSERMKEYLRECAEIQAQLEPGEHV